MNLAPNETAEERLSMKSLIRSGLWSLVWGLPLACGGTGDGASDATSSDDFGSELDDSPRTGTLASPVTSFPGAGTSGAALPLSAALAPESSADCDPQPTPSASPSEAQVQTVCFYDPGTPDVPAATIEQVVEVVDNSEWVHVRLTLNPDFVDNTYGENAIGWGDGEDDAAPAPTANAPPAPDVAGPGDPGVAPPPNGPARPRDDREERPKPGKSGHTFRDLLGSDHAEMQLLDGDGVTALQFRIDYISEAADAVSGYASLGVSGGEGKLIIGEPEWVLAATTSLDRNLNACRLGPFSENSPVTDALYTPDPSATDWDYRVAYEIWVSAEAFGASGFGSALIENVHASPSKLASNTVDVQPAPCPPDPDVPDATPEPIPVVLENIR
jgi:hypothetical protein